MKKKLSIRKDASKILELMVNAELKPYGKSVEDIKDSKDWFDKYTFKKQKDYDKWKKYCITLLTEKVTPKLTKRRIEKEFMWVDFMYGLKCEFDK